MSKFKLVVSKYVKFKLVPNNELLMLLMDDMGKEYSHTFSSKSNMFKQFISEDSATLEKLYTGAPFVFVHYDDSGYGHNSLSYKLIDFRDNRYKGHIHTEDTLNRLGGYLGIEKAKSEKNGSKTFIKKKYGFILGSNIIEQGFNLNEQSQNEFKAKISFPFDPFSANVGCSIGLERLICLNGMSTSSPLFAYKIPIISNVEDNLRVAISQLTPTIAYELKSHISKLQCERASVVETVKTNTLVSGRVDTGIQNFEQLKRLAILSDVTNVEKHCSQYDKSIFNSYVGNLYPSHLTRYDLWNVLTELDSHTNETEKSTSVMVQRFINTLVFGSSLKFGSTQSAFMDSKSKFNASHLKAFFGSDSNGY